MPFFQVAKSNLLSQKSQRRLKITSARNSASSFSVSSVALLSHHTIDFSASNDTPEGPGAFPLAMRCRADLTSSSVRGAARRGESGDCGIRSRVEWLQ
eukprot:13719080-Ditylum_brightwellii.AAC.1